MTLKQAQQLAQNARVRGDQVLILQDPSETQTAGGIVIPNRVAEEHRQWKGVVLATGPGKFEPTLGKRLPVDLSAGDRVRFTHYRGTYVDLGPGSFATDEKKSRFVVVPEEDVLMVLT